MRYFLGRNALFFGYLIPAKKTVTRGHGQDGTLRDIGTFGQGKSSTFAVRKL
jgi:hypothetical protein